MNKKVEKFISDLEVVSSDRVKVVNKLRKMYKAPNPNLREGFIYGGVGIYLGDKLIGGIWVYTNHISVIFGEGWKLTDPDKILEGGGKYRRHIRIFTEEDIKNKKVEQFIDKYIPLETESQISKKK